MSYVVLARKWRPMRFEDLVGQEHVARTLENAIACGRVAHAFLFTGVRGVGKTTSARILAKALNCVRPPGSVPPGQDPGPTATPCLECAPCREIAAGTDVDVREIDGASYTGVDDVRKLQDTLPYRPARDRFKIVIVDEVHMLSQNAWNAFLKTLEEPPPHVKFIFATTEVNKVPVTILSRVQRFDFKLIPTRLIAERLRYVLDQERIEADDAAIAVVAREAAGSMRDAMSLIDQVIAWRTERLTGDDVARVLGVASRQALHDIARAVVDGEAPQALDVVAQLASQGYDIVHVTRDLLALLRDLVVAKVCADPSTLLDLPDDEKRDIVALGASADTDDLVRLHQAFSQSFDEIARSGQQRAALEMLLVRLSRRPRLVPLDDLVSRLVALERRLGAPGGAPKPSEPGGDPGRQGAPRGRAREARSGPSAVPRAEADTREEPPAAVSQPSEAPTPIAPERETPADARRAAAVDERSDDELLEELRPIVERVREQRPELAAVLDQAAALVVRPGEIALGWEPGALLARQFTDKGSLDAVTRAATSHFGTATRVTFELEAARARGKRSLSLIDSERRARLEREAVAQIKGHPRIAEAMEILGAKLKDVKLGAR